MKTISILGVTGSIGKQALEVLRKEKESFTLEGISANTSVDEVINIIEEFNPKFVAMMDLNSYIKISEYCKNNNKETYVLSGLDGLIKIATLPQVDMVLTSIVGMIGLVPTIEAIRSGKDIALANKETLVVGGEIVIKEAKENNVNIIPVDSEHNAIFQCLQGNNNKDIKKIILTASGGPFKGKTRDQLKKVTLEEALNHPKWKMGKKISIDSATLMNKGLEVIEAKWLFDVKPDNIQVVVHPESTVHSAIEYIDNSIIAQLSTTDMKLPIQYALNYPNRYSAVISELDLFEIGKLTFEKPDFETFKCLSFAYEAIKLGGNTPTILNSANEAAVQLFLEKKITFLQIEEIIENALNTVERKYNLTVDKILETEIKVNELISKKYKI